MKKRYFKLFDYCIIAMIAAMGLSVKVILVPLAQIITGPLFIPGGVVAGGFYMAFLVLGENITKKWGTATMIALVQAVVVLVTGAIGSHGAASLLTYTLPGIAIDLLYLILRGHTDTMTSCFLGGIVANFTGSFTVNLAVFNLPMIPLLLSLCTATLSGAIGGLVAYYIGLNIYKIGILSDEENAVTGTYVDIPDNIEDL